MASGLLLGRLVGGPGLFSSYSASARATCTPRTAFVSSDLDLVKGYNSGAADTPHEQPVAPRPMTSPRSGRGAARHSPLPTPPRVEERRASAVLSPPRPLTFANAPGRRVLAPAAMLPRYLCREHGGEGWEAKIEKVRSRDGQAEALVVFDSS